VKGGATWHGTDRRQLAGRNGLRLERGIDMILGL
jgi:hypothetical protein